MKARAAELKAMLGWTENKLNQGVTANPMILTKKPSTVVSNMHKLQAHSFSSTQALNVFASSPAIAGYDWSSSANREKLMYLRSLSQTSLLNTLAPRWHFLILLEAAETDFKAADHLTALATLSDEHFAQAFSSASVGLVYDQDFMHSARGNLCRFCY
ncbi:hypothetical protein ABBQ38_008648 [Trebouxia sp. C0009 RCD-2024]